MVNIADIFLQIHSLSLGICGYRLDSLLSDLVYPIADKTFFKNYFSFLKTYLFLLYVYACLYVLSACTVCESHACGAFARPEKDIRYPGIGITDYCEPLCGGWNSNPGPMEE